MKTVAILTLTVNFIFLCTSDFHSVFIMFVAGILPTNELYIRNQGTKCPGKRDSHAQLLGPSVQKSPYSHTPIKTALMFLHSKDSSENSNDEKNGQTAGDKFSERIPYTAQ